MVVKRVGPVSLAKNLAVLYALMGLIFGAFLSLIALAGGLGAREAGMPAFFGAVAGVGAIVMLPIFYGCMGFVGGLIGASLYNVIAGMIGGVELDIE